MSRARGEIILTIKDEILGIPSNLLIGKEELLLDCRGMAASVASLP